MKIYFRLLVLIFIFLIVVFPVLAQKQETGNNNPAVEKIDIKKLNSIIQNRAGKYLLLNIWATWCEPCREEFPALVKLSEKYKDRIEFVGISVDYPDEVDSKIKPFLKSVNSGFANYVNDEKNPDKFISNLNQDWDGSVPATFIFDAKGKQVKYFTGGKTFDEFEKVILALIN